MVELSVRVDSKRHAAVEGERLVDFLGLGWQLVASVTSKAMGSDLGKVNAHVLFWPKEGAPVYPPAPEAAK